MPASTSRTRQCIISHGLAPDALDDQSLEYIYDIARQGDLAEEERLETVSGVLALLDSQSPVDLHAIAAEVLAVASRTVEDDQSEASDGYDQDRGRSLTGTALDAAQQVDADAAKPFDCATRTEDAVRKGILHTYGRVELDEPPSLSSKDGDDEVSSNDALITERIRQLDLKKRSRKKVEARAGSDLLQPNLNAAIVAEEHRRKRAAAAAQVKAKSEKDKSDLAKQRADQAKRKVEARARTAKVERKA